MTFSVSSSVAKFDTYFSAAPPALKSGRIKVTIFIITGIFKFVYLYKAGSTPLYQIYNLIFFMPKK